MLQQLSFFCFLFCSTFVMDQQSYPLSFMSGVVMCHVPTAPGRDLARIRPTFLYGVPRTFDMLHTLFKEEVRRVGETKAIANFRDPKGRFGTGRIVQVRYRHSCTHDQSLHGIGFWS